LWKNFLIVLIAKSARQGKKKREWFDPFKYTTWQMNKKLCFLINKYKFPKKVWSQKATCTPCTSD